MMPVLLRRSDGQDHNAAGIHMLAVLAPCELGDPDRRLRHSHNISDESGVELKRAEHRQHAGRSSADNRVGPQRSYVIIGPMATTKFASDNEGVRTQSPREELKSD